MVHMAAWSRQLSALRRTRVKYMQYLVRYVGFVSGVGFGKKRQEHGQYAWLLNGCITRPVVRLDTPPAAAVIRTFVLIVATLLGSPMQLLVPGNLPTPSSPTNPSARVYAKLQSRSLLDFCPSCRFSCHPLRCYCQLIKACLPAAMVPPV